VPPTASPPKPAILTLDDDRDVSRAIERDLRRRYGADYRIIRADVPAEALGVVRRCAERDEPIALLVADQRMPGMNGVEFLEQAMALAPRARRVLLTAYADTDAAISAINQVRVHYYLTKPWDPPEQNLYPYLDDLLEDWRAEWRPPYDGVTVVGTRWDAATHDLREFLGRNLVPFRWMDPAQGDDARAYATSLGDPALPAVVLPGGETLSRPTLNDVAARIGLRTRAERAYYDLVVVGAGPAGLAAAVYGASEGLKTLLVERQAPGGQAGTSSNIENYLGFPAGLTGADLTRRAVAQARKFGAEILTPQEVTAVRVERAEGAHTGLKVLTLSEGGEVTGKAVLVATGVSYRTLDVPGAERLTGRGLYYGAAITDAMSCRDEPVYIVGGGNSAGQAAVYFAQYASAVHILVRGPGLGETMSRYLIDQIEATPNVTLHPRTRIGELHGEERLEGLTLLCADGTPRRR
jgi:thioredoxin reductase (NADPH)